MTSQRCALVLLFFAACLLAAHTRQQKKYLHVVGKGNLALLVANDGEADVTASNLSNVLDPAIVRLNGVGRETNQLDATLGELRLELGKGAELGGTDGGVVLGVREEDDPGVADELVEVNVSLGGLGLEVGGDGAETERSRGSRHCEG